MQRTAAPGAAAAACWSMTCWTTIAQSANSSREQPPNPSRSTTHVSSGEEAIASLSGRWAVAISAVLANERNPYVPVTLISRCYESRVVVARWYQSRYLVRTGTTPFGGLVLAPALEGYATRRGGVPGRPICTTRTPAHLEHEPRPMRSARSGPGQTGATAVHATGGKLHVGHGEVVAVVGLQQQVIGVGDLHVGEAAPQAGDVDPLFGV